MKKKNLDEYEFTITRQNHIPDKQNPKFIELDAEFEYNGDTYKVKGLKFHPKSIANGSYERQVCIKIDEKIDKIEGETKHELIDLTGQTIKNSGYDGTGIQNEYPEKSDQ